MQPEDYDTIDFSITGVILAGGKSSRMGTDKGLLIFDGEPLVQKIIRQLQPAVMKTIIISNNPEYQKFGLEVIKDLIPGAGPAGGIYTALRHSPFQKVFVISCDMPFVTCGAIRFIIQRGIEAQIALPEYQNQLQPIFGIYSKDCLAKWKSLLDTGVTTLKEIVTHFNLLQIPVDTNALFGDKIFTNINNRYEYEEAIKYYRNGN